MPVPHHGNRDGKVAIGLVGPDRLGQVDAELRGGRRQGRAADQIERPLVDAALDQAVDIEIARADEHRAVRHDAAAGRIQRGIAAVETRACRVAGDMVETEHVALDEVAVLDVDRHGVGVDLAVGIDVAGLALDRHRSQRIADHRSLCELNIRRRQVVVGRLRERNRADRRISSIGLVIALDGNRRENSQRRLCCSRNDVAKARAGAAAVKRIDIAVAVDQHAIVTEPATAVAVDRQIVDDQHVRRVVDDIDLRITRRPQLTASGQLVRLDAEVAELRLHVVENDAGVGQGARRILHGQRIGHIPVGIIRGVITRIIRELARRSVGSGACRESTERRDRRVGRGDLRGDVAVGRIDIGDVAGQLGELGRQIVVVDGSIRRGRRRIARRGRLSLQRLQIALDLGDIALERRHVRLHCRILRLDQAHCRGCVGERSVQGRHVVLDREISGIDARLRRRRAHDNAVLRIKIGLHRGDGVLVAGQIAEVGVQRGHVP